MSELLSVLGDAVDTLMVLLTPDEQAELAGMLAAHAARDATDSRTVAVAFCRGAAGADFGTKFLHELAVEAAKR